MEINFYTWSCLFSGKNFAVSHLRRVAVVKFQFIDALNFAAGEYVHKQISPIFSHSFVKILTKRSF